MEVLTRDNKVFSGLHSSKQKMRLTLSKSTEHDIQHIGHDVQNNKSWRERERGRGRGEGEGKGGREGGRGRGRERVRVRVGVRGV